MGHPHHHHDADHAHDDFPEPTPEEIFGPRVPAPLVALRAGPVSLLFDPDSGFLRRFRVGAHEALRAVYPAVRTRTWTTVPPILDNLRLDHQADHFHLTFDVRHVDASSGIDFRWYGELTGEANGIVTYRFDGQAASAFETNRTGLCVLHPAPECAGLPVSVEHADGRVIQAAFPATVSPHQPFFDIRALTYEVAPGLQAKVTMQGDAFEMEDQRNWTDASFKTYGGALAKGLPLTVTAGQRVQQSVRFELIGPPPAVPQCDRPVSLDLPAVPTAAVPNLGTRWAPEPGPLDGDAAGTMRRLGFGHLMIEVDVTSNGWRESLARALPEVHALEARIWLRLIMSPNHQPALAELATDLAGSANRLLAVSVCSRSEPCPGGVTLDLVRPVFAALAPQAPIASASLEHFADLNRFRPPTDAWSAVPICPQVHAFDFESMMENVQAQSAVLATLRAFNPHPILVGPVCLGRGRQPDPRQGSLFCAAWTAGSLAQILPTGLAHAVAYHEHAGAMGILDTPTEDVFAGFAGAVGCAAVKTDEPGKVAALAVFDADGTRRVLVANLTRETVEISIAAADSEFEFGAYATAWLEV